MTVSAILFDLDGTLLDTAADLTAAINDLLREANRELISVDQLKILVSYGSTAMLAHAFDVDSDSQEFQQLRERFFERYALRCVEQTQPFGGVIELLDLLNAQQIPWGIVTNKVEHFAQPIVAHYACLNEAQCLVCGDTTEFAKPHPLPLLYACELMHCDPLRALYVGDAKTDVDAGHAAGMRTLVANYGYVPDADSVAQWQAHGIIQEPLKIIDFI